MDDCMIRLKNITKRFPGVVANSDISIDIKRGEIHTLAGENGAGKSTLMNILYGLYHPDEGSIEIAGKPVKFSSSKDAIANKIGMVHQHFMLIPKLTVTENIMVGQEVGPRWNIDRAKAADQIREICDKYGISVDPEKKVWDLSVTQQQRVEILKILYRDAEILIFDEPTAVLTPQDIDEFCSMLLGLREAGKTIIFISHKLAEVMKVSDSITVIRQGKVVGTVDKNDTDIQKLTHMMVGRDVNLSRREREEFPETSENLLEVKDVVYTKDRVKMLDNVNLTLRKGEILGIAGVDGNGQEELVEVICGLSDVDSGDIMLDGKSIKSEKILARKDMGIGLIPEDRHRDAIIMDFSIAQNLVLGLHHKQPFSKHHILNNGAINENATTLRDSFDIRCPGIETSIGTLSGGNQQKVVIAREASRDPDVFIAVQPTRGLDIGAMEFVHTTLLEQRSKGKGVMLFSLELDEIMALSDRIAVVFKGRIVDVVDATSVTRHELGLMMLASDTQDTEGGNNE